MPEKISKMLKYNYDLRSMKNAFVTYADTESLLKTTTSIEYLHPKFWSFILPSTLARTFNDPPPNQVRTIFYITPTTNKKSFCCVFHLRTSPLFNSIFSVLCNSHNTPRGQCLKDNGWGFHFIPKFKR